MNISQTRESLRGTEARTGVSFGAKWGRRSGGVVVPVHRPLAPLASVSAGFRPALPWLLTSLGISMTALIGSGVPIWTLLVFGACAIWRQRVESTGARLPSFPLRLTVFAASTGIVLLTFRLRFDPTALLTFLVASLASKILELRSHRDFVVVALLGYFMILSAFFFNQTLALSLYLALAVVTNTIGLIRCHDGGRKHPLRSSVRLALALLLQTVPVVVLLFVVFPRVQMDFLRLNRGSTGLTGMSEHLQPGAFEALAQSNQIAFRAQIVSGTTLLQRNLYWRGMTLGICESAMSWRADDTSTLSAPIRPTAGTRVGQKITILASGERWLFALDFPVAVNASPGLQPYLTNGNVLRSRSALFKTEMYEAFSNLDPQDSGKLPTAEWKFYTHVPGELSPRVLGLVRGWVSQAQALTGAARENAIIRQGRLFFRDGGFVYTARPGKLPPGNRALDYFLFQSRRGFCEHYAAAFSTLMRSAGLPTRVVLGYQGGEYNSWAGGYYAIRQSDAHAWSEVWITGIGWQREDPTAMVAPDRVNFGAESYAALTADGALSGESRLDRLAGLNSPGGWRWLVRNSSLAWDGLDQQWNLLVLGYDQERQENTLLRLGLGHLDWLEGGALALVAALSLLALGALGVHVLEREQTVKLDPAARLYERFCACVAQWAGVQRGASEGPLDFSKRAAGALPEQKRQIDAITDLYVRSRYASPVHDDLAARTLEALTDAVDNFHEPAEPQSK